uniref:Conotoxin n=1 Tax=Conus betulinus TaxID=89764 RepID=A0A1P7ZCS6_CONBE|nr:Conotoxin [Conus betulinus]
MTLSVLLLLFCTMVMSAKAVCEESGWDCPSDKTICGYEDLNLCALSCKCSSSSTCPTTGSHIIDISNSDLSRREYTCADASTISRCTGSALPFVPDTLYGTEKLDCTCDTYKQNDTHTYCG